MLKKSTSFDNEPDLLATTGGATRKPVSTVLVVLVLLAAAAAALYLWMSASAPVTSVPLATVTRQDFSLQIYERGVVRPAKVVSIQSRLSSNQAKLVWMHPEGQAVKRGQIVARFDTKPFNDALVTYEQSVVDAQAQLASAEKAVQLQEEDNAAKVEAANRKLEIARIKADDLKFGSGQLERRKHDMSVEQARREQRIAQAELADFDELLRQGHVSQRERDKIDAQSRRAGENLELAREELVNFERYELPRLLREAELVVDAAKTEVARVRRVAALELNRRGDDVIKYRRDLATAQQQLARVRQDLRHCDVRAPIDGTLFYVPVPKQQRLRKPQTGDAIWLGQTFLEIPDTRELVIEMAVREVDVGKLRSGMPVAIELDSKPGVQHAGELIAVGSFGDSGPDDDAVRRYQARVRFSDSPPDVSVGMSSEVRIVYRTLRNVLVVPPGAVEYRDGHTWVSVRGAEGTESRRVELGEAGSRWVEVLSGLLEGERIEVRAQ